VGRPLPGVQLRLVTPAGTEAMPGEEGEIRVRSRSATSGYLGSADSSADSALASPLDGEGWLRTGDLGRLDEDGYLYVTGRLKNIIIRGGFNVVPEEVEAALAADPAVREAVVLGVPDERLGEVPVALVVGDPADPPTAEAVLARVRPRLAPYKRPDRVFVLAELPRVPNGKVDRPKAATLARALASQAASGESGAAGSAGRTGTAGEQAGAAGERARAVR